MRRARNLTKRFFDLRRDFHGEVVQSLRQVANILQELIVEDDSGNGGGQTRGGCYQSFGNPRRDGTKARGSGAAEAREGVNDAPHGAEKTDEWGDRTGGGKPGHALFDAANFFRGGELHADSNGLQALQFRRMRVRGYAADLGLEFTITCCIHGRKRRAGGCQGLGIGDSASGTKNPEKLIALAANAAESAKLLKNHRPGNQREEKKKQKNAAGNPAGLRENVSDIGQKNGGEQKNDGLLSENEIFLGVRNLAYAPRGCNQ